MRDRFPLLIIGGLLLVGSLGSFLLQGARRAEHADVLSTFRASARGARGVFLLAQELGIDVRRYTLDLEQHPAGGAFVLLAVESQGRKPLEPEAKSEAEAEEEDERDGEGDEEAPGEERYEGFNYFAPRLSEDEQEALLEHVKAGQTLIYVPWGIREDPILLAVGFSIRKAELAVGVRTLVPAQPAPHTLGVERVEAQVQGFLDYASRAVPLLVDEVLGEAVAAVAPYGAGEIVVLAAPELAMNRALLRADNAQLWASLLRTAAGNGPVYFDEYHHGFSEDRSIVLFARRYGLHFAVAQLLVGLGFWALALRRFGRPRPPPQEERRAGLDALLATSRMYREGHHHGFAAELILQGLTRELAGAAGLPSSASPKAVADGLARRGRRDLATGLREVHALAHGAQHERQVERVAVEAARITHRFRTHARSPQAS